MAGNKGVKFVLTAEGKGFLSTMKQVDRAFAPINKSLFSFGKGMARFGKDMQQAGSKMTTNLTLPLLAMGAAALKGASDIPQVNEALKALKAPFKDVAAAVSGLLIPVLKQLAVFLSFLAGKIQAFSGWLRATDGFTRGLVYSFGFLLIAMGPLIKGLGLMVAFGGHLIKALAFITPSFLLWAGAIALVVAGVSWIVTNWQALVLALSNFSTAAGLVKSAFLAMALGIVTAFSKIPGLSKMMEGPLQYLATKILVVNTGLANSGVHIVGMGQIFGEVITGLKDKMASFGGAMQSDVISNIKGAAMVAKNFFNEFTQQAFSSFSLFKAGSIDILQTFKDVIDQMVRKLIISGIVGLIGGILSGGSVGGSVLQSIGSAFGFDNPVNDRRARSAGESKWFKDFATNFSQGYVNSAVQSTRTASSTAPTQQASGINIVYSPGVSMGNSADAKRFVQEVFTRGRQLGYI